MYPSGYSKDHTYTMSNMNIELKKYVRNPLTVEAIQLTEAFHCAFVRAAQA